MQIVTDVDPKDFSYTEVLDAMQTHKLYRSAMVQSWNKFCFTGGIVEVSVKLPEKPTGLWPAGMSCMP